MLSKKLSRICAGLVPLLISVIVIFQPPADAICAIDPVTERRQVKRWPVRSKVQRLGDPNTAESIRSRIGSNLISERAVAGPGAASSSR